MPRLMIIIGSTRPGRIGLPIGTWFAETATAHAGFELDVADLAEINLPFLDEPKHPSRGEYLHEHTKRWSARVDAADAYVLVTPEYNFAMTAPVKNAFDFLSREWKNKPIGLVSYGGISSGLRAAQMIKQVVTALKMMPLPEQVMIQFAGTHVVDGVFAPDESHQKQATVLLDELVRWAEAMKPLRA